MKTLLFMLVLLAATTARAGIELLPGSSPQVGIVGVPFEPLRVRVTDNAGRVLAGERVVAAVPYQFPATLRPATGAGRACTEELGMFCEATTDARGEATFPALYAARPGTFTVQVRGAAASVFATLHAMAPASLPVLEARQGSGQRVATGSPLAPFVVRFIDAQGAPISGTEVAFHSQDAIVTIGDGESAMSWTLATTDANGIAATPEFTAGKYLGQGRVTARARIPGSELYVETEFTYTITTAAGEVSVDYQDMWWGGIAESGWGLSFSQQGPSVFPVVFAYDARGEPTWYAVLSTIGGPNTSWNYHRWGNYGYSPTSAPYHAYDASRFRLGPPVGDFQFRFETRDTASLGVILLDRREPVTKLLTRQDFRGPTPAPMQVASGMWWGGPSQNGWGISIMQQPGGMFVVWMTYGDDGKATWFVMPSGTWTSASAYEGAIYRASGPRWPDFDTRLLRLETVGSFRLDFDDAAHASFTWSIGPHRGVERIERQPL